MVSVIDRIAKKQRGAEHSKGNGQHRVIDMQKLTGAYFCLSPSRALVTNRYNVVQNRDRHQPLFAISLNPKLVSPIFSFLANEQLIHIGGSNGRSILWQHLVETL
jgi:hypothetical protein